MKTDDITQEWAKKAATYVLGFVGLFMAIVSICMPILNEHVRIFWFSVPNIYYLMPIPLITCGLFVMIWRDLYNGKRDYRPFFTSIGIFFMGYLGLGLSIFPWIIPFKYNIWDAAAAGPGLSLMLVGVAPLLPLILGYTGFCYYIFRGKIGHENMY
jgi:cytochrome d ubiquinol oxidase subunit II